MTSAFRRSAERIGIHIPRLCYHPDLSLEGNCRVCVVELEGARVLVPACARKAEAGMKVKTDTERVRHSRKLVLEFLASSVDLSTAGGKTHEWIAKYEADPERVYAGGGSMGAWGSSTFAFPVSAFSKYSAVMNGLDECVRLRPPRWARVYPKTTLHGRRR